MVGSAKWNIVLKDNDGFYDLDYQLLLTKNSKKIKNYDKKVEKKTEATMIKEDFFNYMNDKYSDREKYELQNSTTAITFINKKAKFSIDFVLIKSLPDNNQIIRRDNLKENPKNYKDCPAYHCHFLFNLSPKNTNCIDKVKKINKILDELYPNKLPELTDPSIPFLSEIINKFEGYDYLVLPHGGQSHGTFNKSIPSKGVIFNDVMERSIYYNLFDGFTARSPKKLETTENYFKTLGISEFINLVTCTDNYSIDKYPNGKTSDEFIPSWMYSSPSFSGLRIALSEKSRLLYSENPIDNFQDEIKSVYLDENNIKIEVKLEPGLNVVIGNSSSGKTLFADSIYRKIRNETNSDYSKYNVGNILVDNPSGMKPDYFSQNYITDLVKKDEENGIDNNLSNNEFLKQVFPFNKNFEQQILKSIDDLRKQLTIFINSAKNIKNYQTKINSIPNFTRLFYLEDKLINPLKKFLPDNSEQLKLYVTDESKKEIDNILNKLSEYQNEIAFVKNYDDEIKSIKKKLADAYLEIEFGKSINAIISEQSKEIDSSMSQINAKNCQIDVNKTNLIDYINELINNYESFWKSYNLLINYNVEFESDTIISAGHSLSIKNKFRLTKNDLIETLNKYLSNKIKSDNISVDLLFDENFSKRPKVNGYNDLIEKIMHDFSEKNQVVYEITHKDGRKFSELSPGLRTSVLLDIILDYDEDQAPLIIDQPEDNLATNYILEGKLFATNNNLDSNNEIENKKSYATAFEAVIGFVSLIDINKAFEVLKKIKM